MQGLGPCGAGLRGFELAGATKIPPPACIFISFHFSFMHKILLLAVQAGKLKGVKRKGWLRVGIEQPENVACHSYRVAFLAMLIGDALNLDTEKMMKMALLHDLAEAMIGDITPHDMAKKDKMEREEAMMKKLLQGFEEYYRIWREFVEGKSKEAEIMQQIDKVEMILQAHEYAAKYGKEKLEEFLKEEENIMHPFLISLLEEMKNSFSSS